MRDKLSTPLASWPLGARLLKARECFTAQAHCMNGTDAGATRNTGIASIDQTSRLAFFILVQISRRCQPNESAFVSLPNQKSRMHWTTYYTKILLHQAKRLDQTYIANTTKYQDKNAHRHTELFSRNVDL
jgi:hypothetical protein